MKYTNFTSLVCAAFANLTVLAISVNAEPNLRDQSQIIQKNNDITVNVLLHKQKEEPRSRDQIIKVLSSVFQKAEVKVGKISCHFTQELARNSKASQKFRQIYSEGN